MTEPEIENALEAYREELNDMDLPELFGNKKLGYLIEEEIEERLEERRKELMNPKSFD